MSWKLKLRKIVRSLSVRISLIFSLCTLIIFLIMGLVIDHLVTQQLIAVDRERLEMRMSEVESILKDHPSNSQNTIDELKSAFISRRKPIVRIERPIGTPLFTTENLQPSTSQLVVGQGPTLQEWQDHQKEGMVLLITQDKTLEQQEWPINHKRYLFMLLTQENTVDQATNYRIMIGLEVRKHTRFLHHFRELLLAVGGLGTLCLMVLGWYATRKGLSSAQSMVGVAEQISAHNLTERLDTDNAPTELVPLASSFNEMLDRLKLTFIRLSEFSSDLAHELRAPINNMMTQTQVCLTQPRDNQTYQEILYSNLEEYERLSRMISDMLLLAQADHGINLFHAKDVDIGKEAFELYEYYDALAEEKGMQLKLSGRAIVHGDQLMLRRALSNLISNAIRYGNRDSIILIDLSQSLNFATITVQNDAAPVPAEQLMHFFDRFYRSATAQQRTDEGTGLGLAITKSIVQMHGGDIEVRSEGQQITFTMRLWLRPAG
ncbi:heavy metal sensor histidine kinase [Aquirhabdus sp.]|uniref:heavy metal sensor histidine kinase n=1 Tax=Aquirhabdus sp. TaxID=2824160 RepID=UPI00396C2E29